ncbi:MAG: hypothetical protein LBH75_04610 [Treponema sp.]|jgi:hypothetical protein|nr:hypothetical protein [Treponema sp.]
MNSKIDKTYAPPSPLNIKRERRSLTNLSAVRTTPFFIILWTLALPLGAQDQHFNYGNFAFSLSPKVLEDGSITDASLGCQYTPSSTGSIRLRFSNGFSFQSEWITLAVNAGVVPIFYLHARQDMSIAPLMDPHSAKYAQDTFGSPYWYADFTLGLFKYVSLALLYDYSKLDYKVISFDDQLKWLTPEQEVVSQSLKLEASALIPTGGNAYIQIGYGRSFDSLQTNSAPLIESGRDYLILAMKTVQ